MSSPGVVDIGGEVVLRLKNLPLRHSSLIVSIVLVCAAVAVQKLVTTLNKRQKLVPGVPVVGGNSKKEILASRQRFVHDGKNMLLEGYNNHKDEFFYVPSKLGERLMLPTKYLDDIKMAPIDQVDFVATFIEMFEGKYTTFGSRSTLHPRVVKAQLNRHLPDVMPDVQAEIIEAFEEEFPKCDDWAEVHVVDSLTRIVARVSSRMFGGPTLSRDRDWIDASIAFAGDGFIGAQTLKKFPEFLKPIAVHFITELKNIKKHYASAERVAIPLLEQRERDGEKALDLLYWMSEQAKGDEKDKKFIAGILLKVSFAAIHTSAAAPSQLLFDLCAMPEHIEPLREELLAVKGDNDQIPKNDFSKLEKLDSIMKESQRFNPLLLITFERVVHHGFTLSNGFKIPPHTTIGIPAHAIAQDPANFDDPQTFDGFRFSKKKAQTSDMQEKGKEAFATANPTNMPFGAGRHVCPGRFFAANEIKAIMAYLLLEYEFEFAGGKRERPESLLFETQNLPDHSATIMFRKRRKA